jgi:hypothetical protein
LTIFKKQNMEISFGKGKTEHGPGVQIDLTGDEVAQAIYTYLKTHNVRITGPLTIKVNGELCESGSVYVDPSGAVVTNNEVYSGRGHKE